MEFADKEVKASTPPEPSRDSFCGYCGKFFTSQYSRMYYSRDFMNHVNECERLATQKGKK